MSYRKTAHSVYDIKYHLVWITKYRKKVLKGQVGLRLRELVRQICTANDVIIESGSVQADHTHLLVSVPPNLPVSKLMQLLKGRTSRKLMQEFEPLRREFWGRHLWAGGYFVASTGNVTDEIIKQYIESQGQQPPTEQDNFDVEEH
ncbi:MAG: IS200/IS605 family transposase [Ardenticatenaceae bacterium]|nr:IS200/IS605 family transposase [Ardenticatenaceae bacterium]